MGVCLCVSIYKYTCVTLCVHVSMCHHDMCCVGTDSGPKSVTQAQSMLVFLARCFLVTPAQFSMSVTLGSKIVHPSETNF